MTQLWAWLICCGVLAAGLVVGGLRFTDSLADRPWLHEVGPIVV